MITNPIYKVKGEAAEYADYALNIYEGCTHRCPYCYVPQVLHKTKEKFFNSCTERKELDVAVAKQLYIQKMQGKLIHLCFTCDPYPRGIDSMLTHIIITMLKNNGNNVQILTKNPIPRDFELLYENDWFGITLTGKDNDNAMPETKRIEVLKQAWNASINTWISFEPVLDPDKVLEYIKELWWVDKMAVGKLNYAKSDIDWQMFGIKAEILLKKRGKEYIIKNSLRKEMEK
jgi:DNA repair photolyase